MTDPAPAAAATGGRARLRENWERLTAPGRVAGVDLARGLAVIGMLAAHLLWLEEPVVLFDPSSWAAVAAGRSSILFATLAGVSMGIVSGGATPVRGDSLRRARGRLAVRAGILFALGFVFVALSLPVVVILPAYALMFVVALPFLPLRAPALFAIAAALAVVTPFIHAGLDRLPFARTVVGHDLGLLVGWHYPFLVWIAFVLAGLAVARAGVARLRVQLWMLAGGSALAVLGYGLGTTGAPRSAEAGSYWADVWTARAHSSGLLEVIGSGGFALATLAVCLLVCRTPLKWVVLPVRATGAMPLTAYVGQLVALAVALAVSFGELSALGALRDRDPFWAFALVTVVACTAWALLVGRGPLEWLTHRVERAAAR
ncbi:heparan-alpha-glucosaminide N-acetyltransferase domain-containing protein [Microbacterium awajiense]|uniref:Heparan-alpha-glucosaminide N-acetyltransferase domain-containing protein n=1 Tax=Microbacterium awajiense TaxID=415214 RepID=A0ABP7A1K0_9MICO